MLNRLFLFIVAALISISGFSQVRERGTLEVIPSLGYSSATMVYDITVVIPGLTSRGAPRLAVTGDYFLNSRWSVRSGITFFGLGYGGKCATFYDHLTYLNIPLHANWHIGKKRKWNLNFGVSPGALISQHTNIPDPGNEYTRFQLALSYGMGYKIPVSSNAGLLIDAQGLYTLTNRYKNLESNGTSATGVSINLGVVIEI
ncbi:MAG: outer membrane beta-barrel protein [Bacteroidota bacterium]